VGFALHSHACTPGLRIHDAEDRTLRARIRLSGDLRSEHGDQVKAEIELRESPAVLDLDESDLVDVEGVRFLNECEAKGISVLRCSPYIREWMSRERSRPEARARKRRNERGASEDEYAEHR
jgi:hypothetical protein